MEWKLQWSIGKLRPSVKDAGQSNGCVSRPELLETSANPLRVELFLQGILAQARIEGGKIDAVKRLILVEAREHVAGLACGGIDLRLQALGADLFHHALHRRVDGADGKVMRLE